MHGAFSLPLMCMRTTLELKKFCQESFDNEIMKKLRKFEYGGKKQVFFKGVVPGIFRRGKLACSDGGL